MDYLRRLAHWLDRPLFPWKKLIAGFSIAEYVFESILDYRQYRVLQRTRIPKSLEGQMTQETYDKSQDYNRAKKEFGFLNSTINLAKSLLYLRYNAFAWFWGLTGLWVARYAPARFSGEISHSLVYIFTISFAETILSLPLSYYNHFVLEEKYGFNKQTVKLWITDMLKGQALGLALGVPIGAAFLKTIQATGDNFFLYIFALVVVVQLFAVTLYPVLIVPLFNKLTPLEAGELKERVEGLAKKLKFPLHELRVIDGSKRSAHSNAYFTGLPWKKKIVLYDTLIDKNSPQEVEAVLAHELGHWQMGHTTKLLLIGQAHVFWTFALFSAFIHNNSLYEAFGFHNIRPIIIGFQLFNEVLSPTDTLLKFLMNMITRAAEFEADAFGRKLGYARDLGAALVKMQAQNLMSPEVDWIYSAYHYSHPVLTERLKALEYKPDAADKVADSEKPLKAADREL